MTACVAGLGDILGFAIMVPLLAVLVAVAAGLCRVVWREIGRRP